MANWFDKLTKATETMVGAVEQATNNTIKTYKEKGLDGLIDKTSDILNKTGEGIEKATINVADKTQDYFKNISETNKDIMDDIETNIGKGTFSSKIAMGLAATVNTTQIMVEDLAEVTKRMYQNIITEQESETHTSSNTSSHINTAYSEESIKQFDSIKLEFILDKILNATMDDTNTWHDKTDTTYIVLQNTWYSQSHLTGGKNAISLLTFHLAQLCGMDYNNPQQHTELQHEAINILSSYHVSTSEIKDTLAKRKVVIEEPVVTKTKAKKAVVMEEPVIVKTKKAVKP